MSVRVSKIVCDQCGTTEWDMIGRDYHCRNCGVKMSDEKIKRELKNGYIKCKIENCKIVKMAIEEGLGYPIIEEGKCLGYSHHEDDEPIDHCKTCELNSTYEE